MMKTRPYTLKEINKMTRWKRKISYDDMYYSFDKWSGGENWKKFNTKSKNCIEFVKFLIKKKYLKKVI